TASPRARVKRAARRGLVTGTATNIITDPVIIGQGIAAVIVQFQPGTGTFAPFIKTPVPNPKTRFPLTQNVLPVGGIAKICLLTTVCNNFLPLLLTQPTTNGARFQVATATTNQLTHLGQQGKRLGIPGTKIKGVGVGGLITVGGAGGIRISVEAAPWTIKTATAIDETD